MLGQPWRDCRESHLVLALEELALCGRQWEAMRAVMGESPGAVREARGALRQGSRLKKDECGQPVSRAGERLL